MSSNRFPDPGPVPPVFGKRSEVKDTIAAWSSEVASFSWLVAFHNESHFRAGRRNVLNNSVFYCQPCQFILPSVENGQMEDSFRVAALKIRYKIKSSCVILGDLLKNCRSFSTHTRWLESSLKIKLIHIHLINGSHYMQNHNCLGSKNCCKLYSISLIRQRELKTAKQMFHTQQLIS